MIEPIRTYDAGQLRRISEITIGHYDRAAEAYREGTRDHDVSQNHAALLEAIEGAPPFRLLDLGCGPGRDLRYFTSLGHEAVGVRAARARIPDLTDAPLRSLVHAVESRGFVN